MTKEQKNKWLVKNVLVLFWHEEVERKPFFGTKCSCGFSTDEKYHGHYERNPDFYTSYTDTQAINFFLLLRASENKVWFYNFLTYTIDHNSDIESYADVDKIFKRFISCSALADAIGEYFKWGEIK